MTSEEKVFFDILGRRRSADETKAIPVTEDLIEEINLRIVPRLPSGGAFRSVSVVLSDRQNIAIVCRDIRPVREKYGVYAIDLVLQEAGYLVALINLFLITRGYDVRYHHSPTARGESFTVATLTVAPSGQSVSD